MNRFEILLGLFLSLTVCVWGLNLNTFTGGFICGIAIYFSVNFLRAYINS